MHLEKATITDFRGIKHCELDFTDEFGRIRNVVPIVGPNTSGKTSILDAISLCLMPVTELFDLPSIALTPASIVRRGAIQARVSCTVRFSNDEIDAARKVIELVEPTYANRFPNANKVVVHWEYPDRNAKHPTGFYRCEPRDGWMMFRGRLFTTRNLYREEITPNDFRHHGGVFQFDQQRRGLAKRISFLDRQLLNHAMDDDYVGNDNEGPSGFTKDPKVILLSLATRASAIQDDEATQQKDFERLKELYAQTCRPHSIVGLYNTETGLDMEFSGPNGIYGFDGLSSGQQMIILLLLNFATKHIHRSIVMIDELELHLHPLWQDRLYRSLDKLGLENQIIFTTHSAHLRNSIGDHDTITTGDLESQQ